MPNTWDFTVVAKNAHDVGGFVDEAECLATGQKSTRLDDDGIFCPFDDFGRQHLQNTMARKSKPRREIIATGFQH